MERARIALEAAEHPWRWSHAAAASAPSRPCAAPSTAAWAWARPITAAASGPARRPDPDEGEPMDIVIPLYDRFTALDAVGPYEVLSRLPGRAGHVRRRAEPGPHHRQRHAHADRRRRAVDDLPDPEVLVVPGGTGTDAAVEDEAAAWTGSAPRTRPRPGPRRCAPARCFSAPPACSRASRPPPTGSTSTELAARTAHAHRPRVVEQGKVITAAGVSSGIDMALTLAAPIAGEEVATGDPARHRVRPRAPVRLRIHVHRVAGDHRAGACRGGPA